MWPFIGLLLVFCVWEAWLMLGSRRAPAVERRGALTGSELRGRALFRRGVTASGAPVVGRVGPEAVAMTGTVAACGGCHGPRGKGTAEGGMVAPNIQASRLFEPVLRSDADAGQWERPAYDDRSLAEAIQRGISSGGRLLGPGMPRFELSEQDLADLLAYLHRLGDDRDPGVSEDRLVLGAALPLSGKLAPVGEDVRAVLNAVFEEVNQQGGLFGRRLELRVEDDSLAVEGADGTDRLLKAGVFALVGSVRTGPRESDARLEEEGLPLVAPVGRTEPVLAWEQVRFVHPSPWTERFEPGLQEFEAFLRRHQLAPRNRTFQLNAYTSARLLVESLRRSGADVSRAGLVSALESFQGVDTGVPWPVTFGTQGRGGSRGGFIVRLDAGSRDLTPLSDWSALSP